MGYVVRVAKASFSIYPQKTVKSKCKIKNPSSRHARGCQNLSLMLRDAAVMKWWAIASGFRCQEEGIETVKT